jgi:hypothetical protein
MVQYMAYAPTCQAYPTTGATAVNCDTFCGLADERRAPEIPGH